MNRYYLTERPPSIGTFPKPQDNKVLAIQTFPYGKTLVTETGCKAWGYVEYEKPLSEKQKNDYELLGPFSNCRDGVDTPTRHKDFILNRFSKVD